MKLPEWTSSVRANLAVMAMVLVFVIVVGDMFGYHLSGEIQAFAGGILTGVIMSYFGKRDPGEDDSRTSTTTVSTGDTDLTVSSGVTGTPAVVTKK